MNHIDLTSSVVGSFAEGRIKQKSGPHDTNAVDGSVELIVILAEVVPNLMVCQPNFSPAGNQRR